MGARIRIYAALAATAAFWPGIAQAEARSQASLRNVSISLIDLMPGDGLAPSIRFAMGEASSFGPSVTGGVMIRSSWDGSEVDSAYFNHSGHRAPFSDVEGLASLGASSASASFTAGEQTLGLHQWLVSGQVLPSIGAHAEYQATTLAPGFFARAFELTPYTQALFTGDGEVVANVATTLIDGAASGGIELSVHGLGALGVPGTRQSATDVLGVTAGPGDLRSLSRPMSVSFQNNSAIPLFGQFAATAYVAGQGGNASIPEPSESLLALAGLSVMALLRRHHGSARCGAAPA